MFHALVSVGWQRLFTTEQQPLFIRRGASLLSHETRWLMPFTCMYWCKALSALCSCSPFPQTVYLVRSAHKPSSWQSGLYWFEVRRVCAAANRRLRPLFCGHRSDHALFVSPGRQKVAITTTEAIISNMLFKLQSPQFKLVSFCLYSHNSDMSVCTLLLWSF